MNYSECLQYLDSLGNEVLTMKFGLETIRRLANALKNPQQKYRSVLIAGTNGKGSVARFLNAIFSESGIRNALYTSPHLARIEERFAVNSSLIEPEVFAHYFTRVTGTIERLQFSAHPTYFDTLTATAFLYFSEQQVEIAFLEVGMGGRLDSTNIVEPVLSIITPIGLDHQMFLGESLEAIAREKAGIMRPESPVLLAPQRDAARTILTREARERKARAVELDDKAIECLDSEEGKYRFRFHDLVCRLPLYGRHQVDNAALAIRAAELLQDLGLKLPRDAIQKGVGGACWMGRIQKVSDHPAVFVDGAHNLDAAQKLAEFLLEHTRAPRTLVFGMMRDKDIAAILNLLKPCFSRTYLTEIHSPRSAKVEELLQCFPCGIPVPSPAEAYNRAVAGSTTVVVTGSFYLVGEVLPRLVTGPRAVSEQ